MENNKTLEELKKLKSNLLSLKDNLNNYTLPYHFDLLKKYFNILDKSKQYIEYIDLLNVNSIYTTCIDRKTDEYETSLINLISLINIFIEKENNFLTVKTLEENKPSTNEVSFINKNNSKDKEISFLKEKVSSLEKRIEILELKNQFNRPLVPNPSPFIPQPFTNPYPNNPSVPNTIPTIWYTCTTNKIKDE
jgi:hypothetical protein